CGPAGPAGGHHGQHGGKHLLLLAMDFGRLGGLCRSGIFGRDPFRVSWVLAELCADPGAARNGVSARSRWEPGERERTEVVRAGPLFCRALHEPGDAAAQRNGKAGASSVVCGFAADAPGYAWLLRNVRVRDL